MLGIVFSAVRTEISAWIELAVRLWPETPLGIHLRRRYWQRHLKSVGRMPAFVRGSALYDAGKIVIGDYFLLAENSVLDASNSAGIFIGDYVAMAREVFIRAANHNHDDLTRPILHQGHTCAVITHSGAEYSIVIESGALISRGVTILSGAHIGPGAVIGAGSVVSGVVPANAIVMGNPGRAVRSRKP